MFRTFPGYFLEHSRIFPGHISFFFCGGRGNSPELLRLCRRLGVHYTEAREVELHVDEFAYHHLCRTAWAFAKAGFFAKAVYAKELRAVKHFRYLTFLDLKNLGFLLDSAVLVGFKSFGRPVAFVSTNPGTYTSSWCQAMTKKQKVDEGKS